MTWRRILIAAFCAMGLTTMGIIAYAAIPDASGVIHACYSTQAVRGQHSVTLTDSTCPTGTTAISWNHAGPQGPQVPQGPQGPAGSPGASGYELVTRTVHLPGSSSSDSAAGPVYCPSGKRAINAGLASLSADQAWVDGVASDPFGTVQNGAARVLPEEATNPGPGSPDFLRNPVPATSGQTPDGTGWTLELTGVRYPLWHGSAYGMNLNIWIACI
jgi:hypothetical protein